MYNLQLFETTKLAFLLFLKPQIFIINLRIQLIDSRDEIVHIE